MAEQNSFRSDSSSSTEGLVQTSYGLLSPEVAAKLSEGKVIETQPAKKGMLISTALKQLIKYAAVPPGRTWLQVRTQLIAKCNDRPIPDYRGFRTEVAPFRACMPSGIPKTTDELFTVLLMMGEEPKSVWSLVFEQIQAAYNSPPSQELWDKFKELVQRKKEAQGPKPEPKPPSIPAPVQQWPLYPNRVKPEASPTEVAPPTEVAAPTEVAPLTTVAKPTKPKPRVKKVKQKKARVKPVEAESAMSPLSEPWMDDPALICPRISIIKKPIIRRVRVLAPIRVWQCFGPWQRGLGELGTMGRNSTIQLLHPGEYTLLEVHHAGYPKGEHALATDHPDFDGHASLLISKWESLATGDNPKIEWLD